MAEPAFVVPGGTTLATILAPLPDQPLPDIGAFDKLAGQGSEEAIREACAMVEPQQNCSTIIRHHGAAGLQRVLRGIAQACSVRRVPMRPRVRAVAEVYGWAVW